MGGGEFYHEIVQVAAVAVSILQDEMSMVADVTDRKSILQAWNDIVNERAYQDNKWGPQHRTPVEWITILTEEVGEAAEAALDLHFGSEDGE